MGRRGTDGVGKNAGKRLPLKREKHQRVIDLARICEEKGHSKLGQKKKQERAQKGTFAQRAPWKSRKTPLPGE